MNDYQYPDENFCKKISCITYENIEKFRLHKKLKLTTVEDLVETERQQNCNNCKAKKHNDYLEKRL